MIIEDPLNLQELKVTDISTARFALKTANDQHFAILHMRETMLKELARSSQEVILQKWLLVKPYLPANDEHLADPRPYVPNPLPESVPQSVRAALLYLDEQYSIEVTRAEAELADQSEELLKLRDELCEKVKAWFINEQGAAWLAGNSAVMGGCTVTYSGGDVTFEFEELNYD